MNKPKVIDFLTLKVDYARGKKCRCENPTFTIDYQNKTVYCDKCGAKRDSFDVLVQIAKEETRYQEELEYLYNQKKEILEFEPRRTILKEFEKDYQSNMSKDMYPTCPCCDNPIMLEKLTDWTNIKFRR